MADREAAAEALRRGLLHFRRQRGEFGVVVIRPPVPSAASSDLRAARAASTKSLASEICPEYEQLNSADTMASRIPLAGHPSDPLSVCNRAPEDVPLFSDAK